MNEEKKVPFKWEYGEETISLQLGMYANNQRLYIGMITHTFSAEYILASSRNVAQNSSAYLFIVILLC